MRVMDPRETSTAIAAKTGDIGSAFYFHPDTLAKAKTLGLDGFRMYFLGRGGVLGDVEPDVVSSAFATSSPVCWHTCGTRPRRSCRRVTRPALHGRQPRSGSGRARRRRRARRVCRRRAAVVAAVDVGGYPLFAGVRAEPVPADAPARAIHLGMVIRELRGSVHLAAVRAAGLTTLTAHAIKRPTEVELFGWKRVPDITDDDRARHAQADSMTMKCCHVVRLLDDAGSAALVAGTDAIPPR